ncbi:hypothetical protein SSYM_2692 [Serratia symbiotica str. Tucson]|uniref:Uncharacterized protein n=2 Tax=Serratia symbiotica TaxID=138074 RepID=E9CQ30_9GAMM|nr:hypothetical protein SSYM_2692 [Serratia symbiotica str. Tucson]CDG48213.1 hypothetical protein SCTVLC_1511 [Serratia symbiotica SCt-VLC]
MFGDHPYLGAIAGECVSLCLSINKIILIKQILLLPSH